MKTFATAQLSAHQSAGDVIGCVNGAGVMCCGRSMAQRSASQTSPPPSPSPPPPSELLASWFLTCWWLKNNADCAEREALITLLCVKITDVYTVFFLGACADLTIMLTFKVKDQLAAQCTCRRIDVCWMCAFTHSATGSSIITQMQSCFRTSMCIWRLENETQKPHSFLWNRFKSCLERCFNCPSYNAHTPACLAPLFLSTGNVICILVSGRLSKVEQKYTPHV